MHSDDEKKDKKSGTKPNFVYVNEEELIRQIEMRPALYGRQRKASLRNVLWDEVSKCVDASVEDCKRRWETLRSTYVRFYKGHLKRKRKWVFFDQMSFLGKQLETESIGLHSSHSDDDDGYIEVEERIEDFDTESMNSNSCNQELARERNHNSSDGEDEDIVVNVIHDDDDNVLEIQQISTNGAEDLSESSDHETPNDVLSIEESVPNSTSNEKSPHLHLNLDSDERFLLSCASALRRLNAHKNSLARLKIQQILYDLEFG